MKLLDVIEEGYNLSMFKGVVEASEVAAEDVVGGCILTHNRAERPYSMRLVALTTNSFLTYDVRTNAPGVMEVREDDIVRHLIPDKNLVGLTKTLRYRSQERKLGELLEIQAVVRFTPGSGPDGNDSIVLAINEDAYDGSYDEEIARLGRVRCSDRETHAGRRSGPLGSLLARVPSLQTSPRSWSGEGQNA